MRNSGNSHGFAMASRLLPRIFDETNCPIGGQRMHTSPQEQTMSPQEQTMSSNEAFSTIEHADLTSVCGGQARDTNTAKVDIPGLGSFEGGSTVERSGSQSDPTNII